MRVLLFQALASAADGAFVVDEEQRIIFWNHAAENLLGYAPTEVLDRACYDVLGGQDAQGNVICQRYCSVAVTARSGREVPSFDMSVRTRLGKALWINVSVFLFPGDESNPDPVAVHLFRNANKRKRNEQLLHDILGAAEQLREGRSLPGPWPSSPGDVVPELTEREFEVLSLLAHGASTAGVARSLCISTSTVRNHIRSILSKLRVHSRLEAVVYGLKHGLITVR